MVSSARNPNESYADRARKASTSRHAPALLKPPPPPPPQQQQQQQPQLSNVWTDRIKAHAASTQPVHMPPPPDDPIQPRSPPHDLIAILDHQDEHDPFVVRVPPHLSRQSSSSTNPLPAADPSSWPLPGVEQHENNTPPLDTAPPSRQNSTASVRHHAYSPSGSVGLSRVQSSLSHNSRSASQSRAQSRSGSSTSSPRLQIRARTLPHDDPLLPDLRLDQHHPRPSNTRSSPALPDPPNHISSFPIDPSPPVDPSYYRRPPVPPPQDMSRYTHNYLPQYALPHPFPVTHIPGHTSPSYIPHSGQGTPPYYPPYPAYMYGHHPFFWGDLSSHSQNHFQQNPPSITLNHATTSEPHAVPNKIEFGTVSPTGTAEHGPSAQPEQSQKDASQPKQPRNVTFGTINPAEPQRNPTPPPPKEEQRRANTAVEHAPEHFVVFSIGVGPDEPVPSRHASRKSSVKSLSRTLSTQPTTSENPKDASTVTQPSREANGVKKPVIWEFGTTRSADLDDPQPPSSPIRASTPLSPSQLDEPADDQPDSCNTSHSRDASQTFDTSETASTTSDVWVVKDYGYGFGDHSGRGNVPDVTRWDARERERERMRESHRDREMLRDRGWQSTRQAGWRHENGVEEGRGGWEQQQQVQVDVPRNGRSRRGSFTSYERGGYTPRRGRGFGGRFHSGRGRGCFFHHQRPGSYPYTHSSQPPPPSLEVLPHAIDTVNGYGHYAPPEFEPYEVVPPAPQSCVSFVTPTHSMDAMRDHLLAQLEYYLSPQNMARDLFLRQQMDNEGWIPIFLLASFKRVRQLQMDTDTVREVLSRSTVVEVDGDWVRMGGRQWEPFVLPNAPRSMVTGAHHSNGESVGSAPHHEPHAVSELGENDGEHGDIEGDCDGEDCEGDDEDDDIVFVIGEEAEGSWMTVPERKQ